jgi:hypothetical protein
MKHAGSVALDQLEAILADLRTLPQIRERTRGIFYRQSKSFLHFHEDPTGLYADLRIGAEFERFPVNTKADYATLLAAVHSALQP